MDKLMDMDEAISILLKGDVTPERVQGLKDCLLFEEPKPNFREQVGMSPEQFKTKYVSLFIDKNSTRVEIKQIGRRLAIKHGIPEKAVMSAITVDGKKLEDIHE